MNAKPSEIYKSWEGTGWGLARGWEGGVSRGLGFDLLYLSDKQADGLVDHLIV